MTAVEVTGTPVSVDADGTLVDVAVDNSPVTVEADGSVAVAVEQVDVTVATSGSSVPVTVEEQTVAVTVPVGTVPDLASTRASVTVSDLFGGTVDFGTNGEAFIDYVRVGRIVHCWIYMFAADDWSTAGGALYIPAAEMPVAIKDQVANPASSIPTPRVGGFGFVAFGDDGTPTAFQAPPAYLDIGGGLKGLYFTIQPNTGGLSSILSPTNPETITGEAWIYTGYTPLEAASAA